MQLQNFKSLLIHYIQQKNANVDFNTNQNAVHTSYVELLSLELVVVQLDATKKLLESAHMLYSTSGTPSIHNRLFILCVLYTNNVINLLKICNYGIYGTSIQII
jgi:hypothetical protein